MVSDFWDTLVCRQCYSFCLTSTHALVSQYFRYPQSEFGHLSAMFRPALYYLWPPQRNVLSPSSRTETNLPVHAFCLIHMTSSAIPSMLSPLVSSIFLFFAFVLGPKIILGLFIILLRLTSCQESCIFGPFNHSSQLSCIRW